MADQTYTVEQVVSNHNKPDKGNGPMREITMKLAGVENPASWYTKAATSAPQPGSQITGSVEPTQYGLKFKKARPAGGFGGGGGSKDFKADPVKQAAIAMESSIKAALHYAELKLAQEKLPEDFTFTQLEPISKFFYRLICEAMDGAK